MPVEPSPKRGDYKTRKEYRFAHKKVKRNNMKQPVVIVSAVVATIAYVITQSPAVWVITAIVTAVVWVAAVRPWWRRLDTEAAQEAASGRGYEPKYKVSCPKCSATLYAPAGDGIKCPKCGFDMKVTPPVAPVTSMAAVTSTAAVGSTAGEIERLQDFTLREH
jgi:DNA-directed RNA polymerase subunit RPC12/RpoP